ncbi:alkaline phosphatase D family protein [Cryptosporangium phraense]|uniref:Alkaline phosphatase family protein n=1 Tax=Cryptosporangium phraense TaxID=2593070 RepID=A0A545ASI3_9ACTN|nr:alkaline phosphatase D family protein [Cryptosporangium phraense]TQS44284.1 alkaline phosphatase family protein [Cryptosporangium phraense]
MAELELGPVLRHVTETSVTVWVETDTACEVDVLGRRARTFEVHGHHYALVVVDGLEPGSQQEYQVTLDDHLVWPQPGSNYPPSLLRTLDPDRPQRLIFGSCRHATPDALEQLGYEPDALDTYSQRMATQEPDRWPDAVLLLGDQVYADSTSPKTQEYIRSRRPVDAPPFLEVADYEEYTALYSESWSDPDIRWLLANVPSAMIFDDHDVRDDWNTSYEWRRDIEATSWWRDRIIGGLTSYWVYQHLGNLSPAALATDPMWLAVRAAGDAGVDAAPMLEKLAETADGEVDGDQDAAGMRWSYTIDYGRTRVVVVDTRCGRVLTPTERTMISDAEFAWLAEQFEGDYDHLLIASSLPWLLPWAIHHIENWNEAICAGSRGPRMAKFGEVVRRAADLEHWGAFAQSFERLGELLAEVSRGERGPKPASISVLSGDVHHAYVAKASFDPPGSVPVYQLVVSPVHQTVPQAIKVGFTIGWSRTAAAIARPLARWAKVKKSAVRWDRLAGPFYGNELGTLVIDGRVARFSLERALRTPGSAPRLATVNQTPLSWRDDTTAEPIAPFPARAQLS